MDAHLTICFKDGSYIRADHWKGTLTELPGEIDEIEKIKFVLEEDFVGEGDSEIEFYPSYPPIPLRK